MHRLVRKSTLSSLGHGALLGNPVGQYSFVKTRASDPKAEIKLLPYSYFSLLEGYIAPFPHEIFSYSCVNAAWFSWQRQLSAHLAANSLYKELEVLGFCQHTCFSCFFEEWGWKLSLFLFYSLSRRKNKISCIIRLCFLYLCVLKVRGSIF